MNAKKKGRKCKYETHVKPRFNEIEKWCQSGATEKEIIKALNVGKSAFSEYKNKYVELTDLLKNNRKEKVTEIKAAMYKRATGFTYIETKIVTERMKLSQKLKETLESAGIDTEQMEVPLVMKKEESTKFALPDVAAGMVLLKHWDKDEKWTNDPQSLELKKQELQLKKEKQENDW